MSLAAAKGPRNHELAEATCDECGKAETVSASHKTSRAFSRGGAPVIELLNAEQAMQKFRRQGWALVKNRLYCPNCESARKLREHKQQEPIMAVKSETVVTPLRQPTLEQRRQIVEMLVLAYDGQAQRYKGHDTDKTLAEAIGGGVMPGWVAEIREQNFGPAGGNEEIEAIRAEIKAAEKRAAKDIADLNKRLDAVCAAVGPRAR